MRPTMIRHFAVALVLLVTDLVTTVVSPTLANAAPGGPIRQLQADLAKVIDALCGGILDTCQAGLTGLERVQANFSFDFVATRQGRAGCPPGKKVLGGGYLFFRLTVAIRKNAPTLDLGSWLVSGTNFDGIHWGVSAIAIRADAGD
jgi:hypothetical protein